MKEKRIILNEKEMEQMLVRMAYEIIEKAYDVNNLGIIGIHTRGVFLAKKIREHMNKIENTDIPFGEIDINLYRDDWTKKSVHPLVKESNIPFDVDDKEIVLIDDVIYTGRTTRAAIDALLDFGRPERIFFAALVDRNHRELPIQPDITGKIIETKKTERVNVLVKDVDGQNMVFVTGE